MPKVYFANQERTLDVPYDANLRRAALDNGIDVYGFPFNISNCRGNGLCGTCKVRVEPEANLNDRTNAEIRTLKAAPLRLSCQATVQGDITVYTQIPLVETRAMQETRCYIVVSRNRLEMVQLYEESKGRQTNVFLDLDDAEEVAREVSALHPDGNWEIQAFDDPLTTQEHSFSYNPLRLSRARLAQDSFVLAKSVGA